MKKIINPLQSFFRKLLCNIFVLDPGRLGTSSEACNILVLECLGRVKPSGVMIMTPKLITKLRFVLGIMH